jgi:hypothetical protein
MTTPIVPQRTDTQVDRKASVDEATLPDLGSGRVKKLDDLLDENDVDAVYRAKMHILNDAMQHIGMGRYQASTIFIRDILNPTFMVLYSGVYGQ